MWIVLSITLVVIVAIGLSIFLRKKKAPSNGSLNGSIDNEDHKTQIDRPH